MQEAAAIDRLREKHTRALDLLRLLMKRETELKRDADAGSRAVAERDRAVRQAELHEASQRAAAQKIRYLEDQEIRGELEAAIAETSGARRLQGELIRAKSELASVQAERNRLRSRVEELEGRLLAEPPLVPCPDPGAAAPAGTQTDAGWPDVEAAVAAAHATREAEAAELRLAVKDLAGRLKRSNRDKRAATAEVAALRVEVKRLSDAGGVDSALRRENAELLAQVEEMRAAQRKFLRAPSQAVIGSTHGRGRGR